MVGNFHLLPVAHVSHLQGPSVQATAPNADRATTDHADRGQSLEPLQASLDMGVPREAQAADGIDQACRSDYGGDGLGRTPSSRGCFVSGMVVGVLLGILSAWLVVAKDLGKEASEPFWNWFVGAVGAKAGCGRVMPGAQGEKKVCMYEVYVQAV